MVDARHEASTSLRRFGAAWRHLVEPATVMGTEEPAPDLLVDVIRPDDLVALTVAGYGVELVTGDAAAIRPTGDTSRLVVHLTYQHLGERAIYEGLAPVPDESGPTGPPVDSGGTPDGENARPVPPVQARPAKGSRLVFALAEDDEVPFSTTGILEALRRLPLVVHPLAVPRSGRVPPPGGGPIFHLPGDVVATVGPGGIVFAPARASEAVKGLSRGAELALRARGARRARDLLSTREGVAVRLDDERLPVVGRPGLIRPEVRIRVRPRPTLSRAPEALETAIEAPFRLIISPSTQGGWTHAADPVEAEGAPHRVELWHSRLGVRSERDEGVTVDERPSSQQIVRAVWTRDREAMPGWETLRTPGHADPPVPFRMSLDEADRHMLVRQSAETWLGSTGAPIAPQPVDAPGLFLSSLGAWLDLHGEWDTVAYTAGASPMSAILSWDHIAPLGRDQYVRVTYPGYLYPFGHRTTLVKLTERKMKDASPSVAGLYQRKFLVVGEPVRTYSQPDLPLTEVRLAPLITPTLSPDPGALQDSFFFPMVGGQRFRFVLHCLDQEGRRVRLLTPLLWVADQYRPFSDVDTAYTTDPQNASRVPASGQDVAFAPPTKGGDTTVPVAELRFAGAAGEGTSVPRLADAAVEIPAVQQLSAVGPVTIEYATAYLGNGFGGAQNAGEVWAQLTGTTPELKFGGTTTAGSDKAGGFMQPNLKIDGLSRVKGTVGDVASTALGQFDPSAFLASVALPKLFGIVELVDLLQALGIDLDGAPNVVSEALDRIESFVADLERAKQTVEDAVADAQRLVDRAVGKAAEVQQQAQQAFQAAQQLQSQVAGAVDDILDQLEQLGNAAEAQVEAALAAPLVALRNATAQMEVVAPQLPPLVREQLVSLAAILRTIADAADLIEDVFRFLNGLASSSIETSFRFEWKPRMQSWPDETDPVLQLEPDSLVLAIAGRASGKDGMAVEVLAELRDFTLHLLPGAELVRFKFDHLSFKAGSSGKPDVDVVLNDIEFVGILGFIEVLKDLIPFDGFSDPPFLDVTAEGLSAGFTLALPNVAVGVFNLSNISLGADVQVPFLGKAVTVGFNFCTRERPFTLAVLFIGGGGWFLIRLSPDGLEVLELGLEAGATLAVDFGVASGSISAMIGIYMRLEGDEGSLSGYFRLRGEVDVLGLISASIELYLELTYEFATGKMVGRASLTIKVEVLFFSASVTISAERRFAGSNGDPNFVDVMGLEADGTSPAWSQYCLAFGGA
ncbi:MAG TPA: hypothetical protein VGC11_15980 [Acidimicrobiia bacterium]